MRRKSRNNNFIKITAFSEMFLLIALSFAIAFVWSEEVGVVSGVDPLGPNAFGPAVATSQPTASIIPTSAVGEKFGFIGNGQYQWGKEVFPSQQAFATAHPELATAESAANAGGTAGGVGTQTAATGGLPGGGSLPAAAGADSMLGGIFSGGGLGGGVPGLLLSGVVWAGIVGGGAYLIGKYLLGMTPNNSKALGFAGATTGFVGSIGYNMGYTLAGPLVGIGAGALVFLALYKKEKKELVVFECYPWEPPLGGDRCEDCNKNPMKTCSEYRCKSLGQSCDIVNPGTDNVLCVNKNKGDVSAPIMQPWSDVLKPRGLKYIPDTTIRPPNRGVKIVKGSNPCLQAYTKLEFGLTTNEPAQCKVSYDLTGKFDNMQFIFGNTSLYEYNHSIQLKVPAPENSETQTGNAPQIPNKGTYTLWTRCRDANGNENPDAFAFRFCVDPGPDTTQPIIQDTSIQDGSPVQFNADKVPIDVYIDEPAQCKWSRTDKAFKDMENPMSCQTEVYQFNANLNFVCSGDLSGIKNHEDNKFCFRCEDLNGNTMSVSKCITLKGTEELNIVSVAPNGTIRGGTTTITTSLEVETAHGANEGASTCYFKSSQANIDSYTVMFGEESYLHNHTIDLGAGNYQFFFKCVDLGGNSAMANTTFTISIDKTNPKITRVYREEDSLKVVTDEDAQCVYSLTGCSYKFEEGLPLLYEDPIVKSVHMAEWKHDSTYYVKCSDLQGNRPSPSACSIVAKGSEL
ncbi:MAG: hypothetical protein Q7S74_00180 [Nanoarchaeota archaeon]|nr:hypothetical protein [Nanoarchaeota archaeon]